MEQPKVFEFAKEIGMETLALMDKLREWKLPVKSHMATLDEKLINEIRTRLQTEVEAKQASKTKKTTVKKAAKPKEASAEAEEAAKPEKKKAAPKSATVKKTAEKKPAAAKKAAAAAPAAAAPKKAAVKKAGVGVIRRKAGYEKEEAKQEAEELAAEQLEAAQNEPQVEAQESAPVEDPSVAKPVHVPKQRGNIIGRMDLKRVTPQNSGGGNRQGGGGDYQQGGGGGAGGSSYPMNQPNVPGRPPRSNQRAIRTGFVAQTATEGDEQDEIAAALEKKKKAAGGREVVEQTFTATEFRKREVIFQPKKKKINTGRGDTKRTAVTTPKASKRIVKMFQTIKVGDLALEMGLKATEIIKKLMASGVMATVNTDLDFDTVSLIVPEFGWEAQNAHKTVEELLDVNAFGDLTAEQVHRPPVVTVMGHVDHGKTTLLDSIRKANVASGEAGGITQHIGAYSVKLETGEQVTFLDTPGHEAFTSMRARGANATDIAIIVVAADDGLMPQTAEAINHAKAAGVPIIIAINKMDRPGANPDRIKQQLTEFEIVPEEWGGSNIFCEVSALQKTGIKELLEQIIVQAEVLELKANPKRSGTGIVIESRMEKGRGAVATVLVQDGSVDVGQDIVIGETYGRVRSMMDDKGKVVKHMGPGFPVEISGMPEVPKAGDRFDIMQDEEKARAVADQRKATIAKALENQPKLTLDQIFAKVKSGDVKELAVVLKADVAGSMEAIRAMIEKMGNAEVKVKIIHAAIGGISESDVLLASTTKGLVIGFNVRPDGSAQRLAKEKNIEIKTYSIIYEMQDELKKALSGLLTPEFVEKSLGRAEVRNTFTLPKAGTIAGCAVVDGKIARSSQLRLVRDGKIIYEGKVSSLKRFKDDAKEVAAGFECGIGIENFNDIKVGDVIESFTKEQIVREL